MKNILYCMILLISAFTYSASKKEITYILPPFTQHPSLLCICKDNPFPGNPYSCLNGTATTCFCGTPYSCCTHTASINFVYSDGQIAGTLSTLNYEDKKNLIELIIAKKAEQLNPNSSVTSLTSNKRS